MLPYTPLHHLLLSHAARPLICTSGNLSEEPMAITADDALQRLGPIADLMLTHDRPIVRPVDDSVARVISGRLQILRRARGYAPLPIRMHRELPTILAVGGHLKNTVALSLGCAVVMTPHIGDLDTSLSVEVHRRAIDDLVQFFDATPQAVACDLHPDYASTRHAEQLATAWGVPLVPVQHHHAHVAACIAEHGLEGPVLGLSWDGTGYGTDRTVWGGEVLLCDGAEFARAAHLRTFPLPGGDRRLANRGVRRWACCTKSSAWRPLTRLARGLRPRNCVCCRGLRATEAVPADQQHGPVVRRRGRVVRTAGLRDVRRPSGDGVGVCRRPGRTRRVSAAAVP